MTAFEAPLVDAAAVVDEVTGGAGDWTRFVDLVVTDHGRLAAAVGRHCCEPPPVVERVADLVAAACWSWAADRPTAWRLAVANARHLVAAAGPAIVAPTGLIVDPGLDDRLPLRPLLEDIARIRGSLIVAIFPGEDDPAADGRCAWDGRQIFVRDGLDPDRLVEVVSHETGHALDPGLGLVDHVGLEDFAVPLGALLADHQPPTVAAAAELIVGVLDDLEPRSIRPPVGSPADLIAWAVLEATPTQRSST